MTAFALLLVILFFTPVYLGVMSLIFKRSQFVVSLYCGAPLVMVMFFTNDASIGGASLALGLVVIAIGTGIQVARFFESLRYRYIDRIDRARANLSYRENLKSDIYGDNDQNHQSFIIG